MGTHPLIIELIKVEVRVNDWREGVLPTQYLLQKLEETTLALKEYETQVAPTGWTFVWDRWVLYAFGIPTSDHMIVT